MNPEKINTTYENKSGIEDNSYVNFGEPGPDLLTNTYGLDDDPRGLGLTGGDAVRAEEQMQGGKLDFADELPMIPEDYELAEYVKPSLPTITKEIDESQFTDEDWKKVDGIVNARNISNNDAIKIYKKELLKNRRK